MCNYTKYWFLFIVLLSTNLIVKAQDISGFWLGVTYPTDPNQAVYNFTSSITQNGTVISGTDQTANPNVDFGGIAYIKGSFVNNSLKFKEYNKNGNWNDIGICYWDMNLVYDPINESITGSYKDIPNLPYCEGTGGGKVELYRIVLKSGTKYCPNSAIKLNVTGKNIRWYDSAKKNNLLATGNTYNTTLSKTTALYITQTLYKVESPAVPITIDIVDFSQVGVSIINGSCGKNNGSITIDKTGSLQLQYSLDGGAFQTNSKFDNLAAGKYVLTLKETTLGCLVNQIYNISPPAAPTITDLKITNTKCGIDNGEITIVASGGTGQLSYSIDGANFQNNATFKNLKAGAFTATVKDQNSCTFTKATTLAPSIAPLITNIEATPTTCGKANGSLKIIANGASLQYSTDGVVYANANLFSDLKSGTYNATIKDKDGCLATKSTSIGGSVSPVITQIIPEMAACGEKNGKLTVTATGIAPLQYSLNSPTQAKLSFQTQASYENLAPNEYSITLKDNQGCIIQQNVHLAEDCTYEIFFPTSFTPNEDGINDVWNLYFPFNNILVKEFTIFNKWGNVVVSKNNFTAINGDMLWDGRINGQFVPSSYYAYTLKAVFSNGELFNYRGGVQVIR